MAENHLQPHKATSWCKARRLPVIEPALRSQLVGALQGPLSQLVSLLTAPQRELVQVLEARSKSAAEQPQQSEVRES